MFEGKNICPAWIYPPLIKKSPKLVTSRELQRNYRELIEYCKSQKKPVYVLRYLQPDAVLISNQLWEELCDTVKKEQRWRRLVDKCYRCQQFLAYSEPIKIKRKTDLDKFDIPYI